MGKCVDQIFVAAYLLVGFAQATVLIADPKDVAVEANEWALFSCTAHCDYSVSWYMAGHPIALRINNSVPGLLLKKSLASRCISNQRTHFFEVCATKTFNSSTFYCAAFEKGGGDNCRCGTGGKCYSRPALLTVKMAAAVATFPQTSAGIPEIHPSPSNSSLCTLQGVTTEVTPPEAITMTTIITVTSILEGTPAPTKPPPSAGLNTGALAQSLSLLTPGTCT